MDVCGEGKTPLERYCRTWKIDFEKGVIADFFINKTVRIFFCEFVCSTVEDAFMEEIKMFLLKKHISLVTVIQSEDYRPISNVDFESASDEVKVNIADDILPLARVGRRFVGSYEALKWQRIALLKTVLQEIGRVIAMQALKEMPDNNTPSYYEMVLTPWDIDYEALVKANFECVRIERKVGFNKIGEHLSYEIK